jgi:tetratricopeptide (TPR) repeat protein
MIRVSILALALGLATPAFSEGNGPAQPGSGQAGAYLAARQAITGHDFAAAAEWSDKALAFAPENTDLLETAITAHLALGDIGSAAPLGRALMSNGQKNQVAYLAVLAGEIAAADYDTILADQESDKAMGGLIGGLITAWAEVGRGEMTQALASFDTLIKTPGSGAFGIYHKALALALAGDFAGADALLSQPEAASVMSLRRAVIARAEILSQLERNPEALALIDKAFGGRPDAGLTDLRRRLSAGEPVAFNATRNATDGLAEVFFTLATALNADGDPTYVLLYSRIAAALRPDHTEALLMSAGLLESLNQFDVASEVFAMVPENDPAFLTSRVGQADAAIRAGRIDDAVSLMQTLAKTHPADEDIQTALGDALRRQGNCDLALPAYSAAITSVGTPEPGNWPLFYKRAGCLVQMGDWPSAEADFTTALALAPNEPRLLNELGYTWVDQGTHLDEALAMIERAVAASPDTGYIVDSLAWAYYRLGRYDEAVEPQEKASRLMPLDPIVTDHLGDIYWKVGRKREAQFQWHRALSFGPEEKDKPRIQRKLEVGLDQVLTEEKEAE